MEQIAQASEPENTAKDRKKFTDLTPAQRYRLVAAIEVNDASPLMSDLNSSLARTLGIRGQHARAILDDIKGWWYGMAVELLDRKNRTRASVTAQELQCASRRSPTGTQGRNLPITETCAASPSPRSTSTRTTWSWPRCSGSDSKTRTIATPRCGTTTTPALSALNGFAPSKITEEGLEDYERLLWDEWDHVFTPTPTRSRTTLPPENVGPLASASWTTPWTRSPTNPPAAGSTTEGWDRPRHHTQPRRPGTDR
ncbi:hypothetical protein [Streptomyces sp. AgN23]|uniref:hypothetical protein n=1 Tax=Streptomyces sp. AgN23 TaxID=1188315 RepID=UPI001B333E6D|nr:hypothetical protein [Streptomyces sp. AgN23]QTI90648.1 hypothetical protein AS97_61330 [Streptomyces sp. AgN23]